MASARSALSRTVLVQLVAAAIAAAGLAGCGQSAPRTHAAPVASAPEPDAGTEVTAKDDLVGWADADKRFGGDATRGKALVARYECNRCHAGTGQPAPTFDRQ